MRWDDLFDDLEGQLEHELGAEEVDLRAEEERLRLGRLALRDRLLAMVRPGHSDELRVALRDGTVVSLSVGSLGRDWMVGELRGPRRGSCLLPLAAIASVLPTPDQLARSLAADPASDSGAALSGRLGLSFVLRDLCRRRAPLEIGTTSNERLYGTLDRVGRDHVDLAEHEPGVPRRTASVARIRIVPLAELLVVRF